MLIKTFLFDLDGTLIQSTGIIIQSLKETFAKHFPNVKLSDKDYSAMLGQTLYQTFGYHVNEDQDIEIIVEEYRAISDALFETQLVAYPQARDTMMHLKSKGCQIGVVTSKKRDIAFIHLRRTQLLDLVDDLVGYEDVDKHKPDPEPILLALSKLDAKPEETVYIGDHENDIKSAKAAGVQACAVTYSTRLAEMLVEQPEFAIDELSHLKDLI